MWLIVVLLLSACAARPPAPIEERSGRPGAKPVAPGYYRVNSGDTLYAIAFGHGLDFRRLARWNDLREPYLIYPGQDLRLSAPSSGSTSGQSKQPRSSPPAESQRTVNPPAKTSTVPKQASPTPAQVKPASSSSAPAGAVAPSGWLWPVPGRVLRGFLPSDPSRNGIDIAGREGESVVASAAGKVVYSGNGLLGYGELIIIKHGEQWLSAYGHNRKRLVAEGDAVKAGQKIAELGRNDRSEPVLHFEIRSHGKPVNPLGHLPAR